MWYLIFIIIACVAGVVIVNNCIERKNQKLRDLQNEKTKILKIPPAPSGDRKSIGTSKDLDVHRDQTHLEGTHLQQDQIRKCDEMYWLMIQNYRF